MSRAAFLTILLVAVPAVAPAQPEAPLTLDEAVSLALSRNPEMRAAAAGEEAAAARLREARAGWFPRVEVVEGWQRGDHPVFVFSSLLAQRRFTAADFALDVLNEPDALSNFRTAVSVEQALFDGLRTRSAARAARLGAEAAGLESTRARAELRLSVVAAFGRALAAQSAADAARTAVATAEEDLRRATDRRDAGLETDANVLAFGVRHADADARRIQAAADAAVARAALNAVLAVPLDDRRPLAPFGPPPAAALDAAALEAEALAGRAEVRQAVARREQAQAGIAAARSAFWPQVYAQAGAEANGRTFGDRRGAWSAGLQVRWTLSTGGADAARAAEAAAQAARADAEGERIETGIRLAVRSAAAAHEAAVAREATGRQVVEQARESQRIIRDRYEAGLAPASEVLRAAELLAQSEAARIAASIDVHVTAAALERAAGRFDR